MACPYLLEVLLAITLIVNLSLWSLIITWIIMKLTEPDPVITPTPALELASQGYVGFPEVIGRRLIRSVESFLLQNSTRNTTSETNYPPSNNGSGVTDDNNSTLSGYDSVLIFLLVFLVYLISCLLFCLKNVDKEEVLQAESTDSMPTEEEDLEEVSTV